MDGNGRWAELRGLARVEGHKAGTESVKATIKSCMEQGVKVLSLFAFSSENWSRPTEEVQFLMQLFVESLSNEIDELHQRRICLRFTGAKDNLSTELQQEMHRCSELTRNNERLILNIVVNYGGKWDIVQAARHLVTDAMANKITLDDIDETLFSSYLDSAPLPEPDLFIRTSGEQRISNFFLWQIAYSELYFCQEYWPDFNEASLEKAIAYYAKRERRYGLTSNQLNKESDA